MNGNLETKKAVDVSSLPLPPNASTESTLAAIKVKTDNLDVALSTRTKPSDTQLVDGSAHTQPVSQVTNPWIVQQSFAANQIDLWGRQRVGSPQSLFGGMFIYDKQPLLWDELLSTGGTSTFNTNQSSIALVVTTSSGSRVVRQTKEYFAYEPGRAEQAEFTGVFGTATANCRQMIGLFDDSDGCFFDLNGTTFGVTVRTSTSGSAVDTTVTQTNFNLDKLNGTGPSGQTIDLTKCQIFVIEYQWLGVGTVRFGVFLNNTIVYCHQIQHTNSTTVVYMKRGSLPIRYEIVNSGTLSGAVTLTQICCTVFSEAGYQPTGSKRAADNGTTGVTVAATGSAPLISIRLKAANIRSTVIPQAVSVMTSSLGNFRYQVILNGTLTGATFANSVANSVVEYDTAATALSGGTILSSGYISSQTRQEVSQDLNSLLKLVSNIAGTSDIVTLYATNISAGMTYFASLEWEEFI